MCKNQAMNWQYWIYVAKEVQVSAEYYVCWYWVFPFSCLCFSPYTYEWLAVTWLIFIYVFFLAAFVSFSLDVATSTTLHIIRWRCVKQHGVMNAHVLHIFDTLPRNIISIYSVCGLITINDLCDIGLKKWSILVSLLLVRICADDTKTLQMTSFFQ